MYCVVCVFIILYFSGYYTILSLCVTGQVFTIVLLCMVSHLVTNSLSVNLLSWQPGLIEWVSDLSVHPHMLLLQGLVSDSVQFKTLLMCMYNNRY